MDCAIRDVRTRTVNLPYHEDPDSDNEGGDEGAGKGVGADGPEVAEEITTLHIVTSLKNDRWQQY